MKDEVEDVLHHNARIEAQLTQLGKDATRYNNEKFLNEIIMGSIFSSSQGNKLKKVQALEETSTKQNKGKSCYDVDRECKQLYASLFSNEIEYN